MTTICTKLFHIVKPHCCFSKKDYRQYITIKRMVTDLNMDLEIVGLPTVREANGLAIMSSRNVYLKEERPSACTNCFFKIGAEAMIRRRESSKIINRDEKINQSGTLYRY